MQPAGPRPAWRRPGGARHGWAAGAVLAAALWLGALAGPAPRAHAAAHEYTIDAEASQLRLLVLRRGVLTALAHDHVLVAKGMAGRVTFNPEAVAATHGQLTVPVAFLEVDDPKERVKEGFTSELNESNRASVRENMLAADQLDAAGHPRVSAVIEGAEGALPTVRVHLRLKIRDQEQTLIVPVSVALEGGTLRVQGEADLTQSAFGITPYSSLFGAIAVQDVVHVKFQIVAQAD